MRQFVNKFKQYFSQFKPYLRWVILGGVLFFLAKALKDNWQEVAQISLSEMGWVWLLWALVVTLLAHFWSAWVWVSILREFKQPVPVWWGISVYLQTNIAKYLPGNIWHFYGRILAVREAGVAGGVAVLSVLIEPILMAVAALLIGFIGFLFVEMPILPILKIGKVFFCVIILMVLAALHPFFLNSLMNFVRRLKQKTLGESQANVVNFQVKVYPFWLLLGELVFVLLRGLGFLFAVWAIFPSFDVSKVPMLLGGFSLAWLLGLVVPGAPGGIGIFEATAVVLLSGSFGAGTVLSGVAFYRLISVLAEGLAAISSYFKPKI